MLLQKEREKIVEYGIKSVEAGLCVGTAGNISILDRESGYMVIKPSGLGYYETKAEDVVVMTLDGEIIEGERTPSSEWAMHAAFYRARENAVSVVHTHQPFCTTFACLQQPIKAAHYVVAAAGDVEVKCSRYETFGTPELAESAIEALGNSNAVLLANHGLITCGVSIEKAFGLARNLEFCAEMQWRAMAVGEPVILSEEQMADVTKRFGTYGQKNQKSKGY